MQHDIISWVPKARLPLARFLSPLLMLLCSEIQAGTCTSFPNEFSAILSGHQEISKPRSLRRVQSRASELTLGQQAYELAKVRDMRRLEKTVKIYNLNDPADRQALGQLPDGTYPYLIESRGFVAIGNRVMDPGILGMQKFDATFILSHEGLEMVLREKLKEQLGPNAQMRIVGAGEAVRRFGRTLGLSNQSGTRSRENGKRNLQYATQSLHRLGLPFDQRTDFRDFEEIARQNSNKKLNDRHDDVYQQVLDEIQFLHNPASARLLTLTRNVMTRADALVDARVEQLLSKLRFALQRKDKNREEYWISTAAANGTWLLTDMRNFVEGEASRIRFLVDEKTPGLDSYQRQANFDLLLQTFLGIVKELKKYDSDEIDENFIRYLSQTYHFSPPH